jgi:hypothetical protein
MRMYGLISSQILAMNLESATFIHSMFVHEPAAQIFFK